MLLQEKENINFFAVVLCEFYFFTPASFPYFNANKSKNYRNISTRGSFSGGGKYGAFIGVIYLNTHDCGGFLFIFF